MTRAQWLAKRDELAKVFADASTQPTPDMLDTTMRNAFGPCPEDPSAPFCYVNIYGSKVTAMGFHDSADSARDGCTTGASEVAVPLYRHPQPEVVECGWSLVVNGNVTDTASVDSYGTDDQKLASIKRSAAGRTNATIHRLYRTLSPVTPTGRE